MTAGGERGLDAWYLATLGDDALIVLAEALPELTDPVRSEVAGFLQDRATFDPAFGRPTAWQAWNLSHERARELAVR